MTNSSKSSVGKKGTNLLCNFRVQSTEDYQEWEKYKKECKERGLTVCRPLIALIRSFNKMTEALEGAAKERGELIEAFPVLIQLKQNNTFVWTVEKPRRMPSMKKLSKYTRNNVGTTTTPFVDAYITEKARYLWRQGQQSFCFMDFRELKHSTFRKAILRLKRTEELVSILPRTCPQFYRILHPIGMIEDPL